ncbi:MAG: hypothetical protein AAFY15_10070 [Cyanobacteria bacterium J06648_11]
MRWADSLNDDELMNWSACVMEWLQRGRDEPEEADPRDRDRLNEEAAQLHARLSEWSAEYKELMQERKQMGVKRSVWHPFGTPEHRIKRVESEMQSIKAEAQPSLERVEDIDCELTEWNDREQRYRQWLEADETQQLQRAELAMRQSSVRKRLQAIQRHRDRLEQLAPQLNELDRWRESMDLLGKSEAYLRRIDEVRAALIEGEPLSERAKAQREEDMQTYQSVVLAEPENCEVAEQLVEFADVLLEHEGRLQPDGVTMCRSKEWMFLQTEHTVGIIARSDGRTVVKAEGDRLVTFQPTPNEFYMLKDSAERYMEQIQERERAALERDRGPSLSL